MGKNVSVFEQIDFRPTNSNELWSTTEVPLYIKKFLAGVRAGLAVYATDTIYFCNIS